MAMEIDLPKPEELFRAAENGDVKLLASLSAEALGRARSLRNEDGQSLPHVAASICRTLSGFDNSEEFWGLSLESVVDAMSAADPSTTGVNSEDEEGWANAEIVEILLSRGE